MRKALWSAAALIALLSGATLVSGPSAQAAPPDVTMGSDAEPNAFKFFPKEINVQVNSTVVWQNKSGLPHDVKADDGSFKSDLLNKGETYPFKFATPGRFRYICTVEGHEAAGMEGYVNVAGDASTTTTAAAAGGTTSTTAATAGSTTTTTAKAAAGASTTTTTTTAGGGVTSTTLAPSVTPTSAPETGGATTTSSAPSGHADEAAADGHGGEESKKADDNKSSPLGIAFVAISTVLLVGISGKLLASKS